MGYYHNTFFENIKTARGSRLLFLPDDVWVWILYWYVLLQARELGGGKTSEDTRVEGDKPTEEDPSPAVSIPVMVIPTDSMLTETEARLIGTHLRLLSL